MKLLATHAFNCIVLMIKFGRTSCEDIPLALCNIDVSEDFVSYASNAMSQLRHSRRTNVLYSLAKGIETLREDNSDSRLPTKRMPMGLIEYTASFLLMMIYIR